MEPDIFEKFDRFVDDFDEPGATPPYRMAVHPSLDWLGMRLWVDVGCIMLHEDGKDE